MIYTRLLLMLVLLPLSAPVLAEDYPGRAIFPSVKVIETPALAASFDDVTIVDVRSTYEFETLHLNGAVNVPLSSKTFAREMRKLADLGKTIVCYCNGHTCYKSYKAVLKANQAGIGNVQSYDSGIFDWANAHPDRATMLGSSPVDPARLISKQELKKRFLDPSKFSLMTHEDDSVVLDIRDPMQRGFLELYPFRQENISLVEKQKLEDFLGRVSKSDKVLLVYDEAGKQVRWLQYYLEAKGIKDYFFMTGGVKKFLKDRAS